MDEGSLPLTPLGTDRGRERERERGFMGKTGTDSGLWKANIIGKTGFMGKTGRTLQLS